MELTIPLDTATCTDAAALLSESSLTELGADRSSLRALRSTPLLDWFRQCDNLPMKVLSNCGLLLQDVNKASSVALSRLVDDPRAVQTLVLGRPYFSLRSFFVRNDSLVSRHPLLRGSVFHAGYSYDLGLPPYHRSYFPSMSNLVVSYLEDYALSLPPGIDYRSIPGESVAIVGRGRDYLSDADIRAILTLNPDATSLPLLCDELGGRYLLAPQELEVEFKSDRLSFGAQCELAGLEAKRIFSGIYGIARIPADPTDPSSLFRVLGKLCKMEDVVFAEPHVVAELNTD